MKNPKKRHTRKLSLFPLAGKSPAVTSWKPCQKKRYPWPTPWASKPGDGIAIVCGPVSGILVVDADSPGAVAWCEKRFPKTLTQDTKRGRHYFFRAEGKIGNSNGRLRRKVDVRSKGGYVRVHDYRILDDIIRHRAQLPRLPRKWRNRLKKRPATHNHRVERGDLRDWLFQAGEVLSALSCIDPNCTYYEWTAVAVMVKRYFPGDVGERIFWSWSDTTTGETYPLGKRRGWWRSIDSRVAMSDVFFAMATERGFKGPGRVVEVDCDMNK